jgi:hypothetical protein
MTIPDIPSPVDLRLMSDASEWEAAAMEKRPWRTEFFSKFVDELLQMEPPLARVLELGSGPGFLAMKDARDHRAELRVLEERLKSRSALQTLPRKRAPPQVKANQKLGRRPRVVRRGIKLGEGPAPLRRPLANPKNLYCPATPVYSAVQF